MFIPQGGNDHRFILFSAASIASGPIRALSAPPLRGDGRSAWGCPFPYVAYATGIGRCHVLRRQQYRKPSFSNSLFAIGRPGGYSGAAAPDPIPNSAVKRPSAHDTSSQDAGKSVAARSANRKNASFFFFTSHPHNIPNKPRTGPPGGAFVRLHHNPRTKGGTLGRLPGRPSRHPPSATQGKPPAPPRHATSRPTPASRSSDAATARRGGIGRPRSHGRTVQRLASGAGQRAGWLVCRPRANPAASSRLRRAASA